MIGHEEDKGLPMSFSICAGCGEAYDGSIPTDPDAYYAEPRAYSDPTFVPHYVICTAPLIPKKVSAGRRAEVIARDGSRCLACGTTEDLTVDHIKHQSRGGGHEVENLRTLCRSCNSRRGAGSLPAVDGPQGSAG